MRDTQFSGGASAPQSSGRRLGDLGAVIYDLRTERERRSPTPEPVTEPTIEPPFSAEFVTLAALMEGLAETEQGRKALRKARASLVRITGDDGLQSGWYAAAHFIVVACNQIGLDKLP